VIGLVALSREVHGETFEITERAVSQGILVRSTQDDAGCLVGLECFLPARCAKASTLARFQPWKAKLGLRRRQIIAARFGKFQNRRSHDGADRMTTHVLSPSVAAAVLIKSCHRCEGADFKRLAEYIAGGLPATFPTSSVIPQHRLPLALPGDARVAAAPTWRDTEATRLPDDAIVRVALSRS